MRYFLGELAQTQVNHDAASRHWRAALSHAPDFEAPYLALCRILLQQDRHAEALQLVAGALEYLPQSPDLHFYLALALNVQGKNFAAIECYRNAPLIDPMHVESRFDLAHALQEQKK